MKWFGASINICFSLFLSLFLLFLPSQTTFNFCLKSSSNSINFWLIGKIRSTERTNQKRVNERKEQYKQVRAHVKKEDGRMQAYGWSLPAKVPQQSSNSLPGTTSPAPASDDGSSKGGSAVSNAGGSSVPVPVPVYCRPLMEKEPGMKVKLKLYH